MTEQKKIGRVKRSRLGRGLSALVEVPVVVEVTEDAATEPEQVANIESDGVGGIHKGVELESVGVDGSVGMSGDAGGGVIEIAVGLIGVNRDQPRRVFDEDRLAELSASIVEHGLMQPVVVRRVGEEGNGQWAMGNGGREEKTRLRPGGESGHSGGGVDGDTVEYELIAGERRWRACMLGGLETIPAIVREVDDATSAQLALIENIQREDLNVIELAMGFGVLSDRYSMTQEQIARTVGVSRSSVANTVRLLDLPEEVRGLIAKGSLSAGHGKVLLSLGVGEKQRRMAARCLKHGWNVRELVGACGEEIDGVAAGGDGGVLPAAKGAEEDRALSVLRDLERRASEGLGTRVRIRTDKSRTRGRVVIEFYDLDQFDGLLSRLGVNIEG